MRKPKLENEFSEPKSPAAYEARKNAFDRYNNLLKNDPRRVAEVLAMLAIETPINQQDKVAKDIAAATEAVFTATNNGTQIGFDQDSREATWADVHNDSGHREAATAYNMLSREGKETDEGIRLCKLRGGHTLKVVALLNLDEQERRVVEASLATLRQETETARSIAA